MNCGNNRFTVWFCVMQMTISIRSLLFFMPFYSHILWNCVIRKWFILETTFCHDIQCLFCANDHSNKFFIICLAILITCTYLNMVALHVSLKFSGKNLSKLWTHKKGNKYGHRKNSAENEEILCRNAMLYLWFFQTSLLESF